LPGAPLTDPVVQCFPHRARRDAERCPNRPGGREQPENHLLQLQRTGEAGGRREMVLSRTGDARKRHSCVHGGRRI